MLGRAVDAIDSERRDHLLALRHSHLRRLQVLERQAALTGISSRPEVILEIEDIRAALAAIDAELAALAVPTAPQAAQRALAMQQQRKQVTILSGLFENLSELSAQTDPEELV